MEKFTFELTEEQINYLQRLGNEVDTKIFLIDRMMANHANDDDLSLFESKPFKHFMSEYEKAFATWEMAKQEFEKTVVRPLVVERYGSEAFYTWAINDFNLGVCEVTIQ